MTCQRGQPNCQVTINDDGKKTKKTITKRQLMKTIGHVLESNANDPSDPSSSVALSDYSRGPRNLQSILSQSSYPDSDSESDSDFGSEIIDLSSLADSSSYQQPFQPFGARDMTPQISNVPVRNLVKNPGALKMGHSSSPFSNLPEGIQVIQVSPQDLRNLPELLQGLSQSKINKHTRNCRGCKSCQYGNPNRPNIMPASSISSSIQEMPIIKKTVSSGKESGPTWDNDDGDDDDEVEVEIIGEDDDLEDDQDDKSSQTSEGGAFKNFWNWF